MSKYDRVVKGVTVDVYDVLAAWKVSNPAVQHAIKKLLQPGARGNKTVLQDLEEAGQSIARAIEIETRAGHYEPGPGVPPKQFVDGPTQPYARPSRAVGSTHQNVPGAEMPAQSAPFVPPPPMPVQPAWLETEGGIEYK